MILSFARWLVEFGIDLAGRNGKMQEAEIIVHPEREVPTFNMIHNRTEDCAKGAMMPQRSIHEIRLAVPHRLSLEHIGVKPNVRDVSAWFEQHEGFGHMPYTIVIWPDGVMDQALYLSDKGPHAYLRNPDTIGVAIWGRTDKRPATREQIESGRWLFRHLALALTRQLQIAGHDELDRGSKDPDKKCPGDYYSVDLLRAHLLSDIKQNARTQLIRAGMVWGDRPESSIVG